MYRTCLRSHRQCGEKSLLCQCRTFQSASMTAGEQWIEASIRASSWSSACFLSTPSSSGAERSWLLLHIYFCLSPGDIWRAHLLQKTRTAGCPQRIEAREPPEVSNMCWKADQKVQYSRGSICQGHRRQEQQMFLMLLWGLPVLLSLSPSFLPNYWHCWGDRESTATCCPEVLRIMDRQRWFNFFL